MQRSTDHLMVDLLRRIAHAIEHNDRAGLERLIREELAPLRDALYDQAGRPPRAKTYNGRERVERLLRGEAV